MQGSGRFEGVSVGRIKLIQNQCFPFSFLLMEPMPRSLEARLLSFVLVKLALYASISAQNVGKLRPNYALSLNYDPRIKIVLLVFLRKTKKEQSQ